MALTTEQHIQVWEALVAEQNKAGKAIEKAEKEYNKAPHAYGGSVELETAVVLLNLRKAQYQAAKDAAAAYFDAYIENAA